MENIKHYMVFFEAEANAVVTIRVIDFKTSGWTDIEIKDFYVNRLN